MNYQLIGSAIGSLLALTAVMPNPVQPLGKTSSARTSPPSPVAASPAVATVGNLTISTVPGNAWVRINDYVYTPRLAPVLRLEGWRSDFPVRAVVRDARNSCIGRITNETGQLRFIFVEADPPMCGGNLPGPRWEG